MKKYSLFLFIISSGLLIGQPHSFTFSITNTAKGTPILHLSSDESFPCSGYTIVAHQAWRNDTAVIYIRGFRRPHPCLMGMAAATCRIELTGVSHDTLAVQFRWREMVDRWRITVLQSHYSAQSVTSDFTSFGE